MPPLSSSKITEHLGWRVNWWERLGAPPRNPAICFQETWIFPNILLFYPEAARAMLEYRIRTLEGALHNAREQGYEVGMGMEVLGRGQCSPHGHSEALLGSSPSRALLLPGLLLAGR